MSVAQNALNIVTISDQLTEVLSIGALTGPAQVTEAPSWQFTNGTSASGTVANVIDDHWELLSVTLASSASVTYTLSGLTDTAGRTVALARVHKLLIYITSKTGNDFLSVGNAASNPWTGHCSSGTALIKVFDALLLVGANATGYVVGSGSSDQLKILNSGSASITFNILVSGCST
jgi:hypothetical protein